MLQVYDDVNFDARTVASLVFSSSAAEKKQKAGYEIITILPMCKYKESHVNMVDVTTK